MVFVGVVFWSDEFREVDPYGSRISSPVGLTTSGPDYFASRSILLFHIVLPFV